MRHHNLLNLGEFLLKGGELLRLVLCIVLLLLNLRLVHLMAWRLLHLVRGLRLVVNSLMGHNLLRGDRHVLGRGDRLLRLYELLLGW